MSKPQQSQPKPIKRYRVSLRLIYVHTYEPVPYEADDIDDVPEPCDEASCPCHIGGIAAEPPLTDTELDAFLCEQLYSHDGARYYWFIVCAMEYYTITDTVYHPFQGRDTNVGACPQQYRPGGHVSFTIACNLKPRKIERKLINSRDVFYDAGPGSESKVPTRHRYSFTSMATFKTDYTENERGRIEVCDETGISITELVSGN
jgi:hypothetical protein